MAAAARLGRALGSAEGLALAAKATLVQGTYLSPATEKQALFEQAASDARAALARAPNHVDAHLQLAVALGQLADLEDPITAHVNGYAEAGKTLIDRALALDPGNEWGRALLGMWHLEVVHHAGDTLAEQLYGASRDTGIELCSKTMAAADAALALKYGCATLLVELDAEAFGQTAARTLAALKEVEARDATDRLVQAHATRFLAKLKAPDPH